MWLTDEELVSGAATQDYHWGVGRLCDNTQHDAPVILAEDEGVANHLQGRWLMGTILPQSQSSAQPPRALSTKELLLRVRHRFSGEGYHVLKEVRFDRSDSVYVGGRTRRADAVAVGIERRTKHAIHGVELKVTRADWMQELRDTTKAADVARFCHYWWLAVGDATIVRDGELPEGWGLLVPRGRHLVAKVQPTLNTPEIDHRFIASLVGSASTQHGYCRAWARMQAYSQGMYAGRAQAESYWRRSRGAA